MHFTVSPCIFTHCPYWFQQMHYVSTSRPGRQDYVSICQKATIGQRRGLARMYACIHKANVIRICRHDLKLSRVFDEINGKLTSHGLLCYICSAIGVATTNLYVYYTNTEVNDACKILGVSGK
jgi:hypothetical protein